MNAPNRACRGYRRCVAGLIGLGFVLSAFPSGRVWGQGVSPLAIGVSPAPASRVAVTELFLRVGEAQVIEMPGVRRIAVGNGRVIQATAMDNKQVLVVPETEGVSSLHLWSHRGRQHQYMVRVVSPESNRLLDQVRAMLAADANLRIQNINGKVVIDGDRVTADQVARVKAIASLDGEVVSLLNPVGVERMIAMDVRIVELKRSALENIGVHWNPSMQGPAFGLIGDAHRAAAFRAGGPAAAAGLEARAGVNGLAGVFGIATTIGSMINLMQQTGDAVVLAEPRLSCRSGGSARFVVGGELPIPQTSGLGAVSVQFKEYGVKFDISPLVSGDGMISAKVATEISSVNFEVQVNDIPGLLKRRAETEVNLRENETLVIAGLVTKESVGSIDKVPGLAEVPILGHLFRSRQFRDQQSDLVVFVTPRFIDSSAPTTLSSTAQPLRPGGASGSDLAPTAWRSLVDSGY
ncbi:MAG: pilus assembly protein N-terminal domain-containing protein [Burkholderiaceae bacterium]|nr:pilus assembly protein N-terminal domain-containing protein [Burkholderiaceae bacterium]